MATSPPGAAEASSLDVTSGADGVDGQPREEMNQQANVMESIVGLLGEDELKARIEGIKSERKAAAAAKKALTLAIKNESRKRARAIQKASRLSNADILDVLRVRQQNAAKRAAAASR